MFDNVYYFYSPLRMIKEDWRKAKQLSGVGTERGLGDRSYDSNSSEDGTKQ